MNSLISHSDSHVALFVCMCNVKEQVEGKLLGPNEELSLVEIRRDRK